jgi:hypothetical protein
MAPVEQTETQKQPAQYLVVRQPGAQVPGVGFVTAGSYFFAPAGYVPSRYMRAMNKEAQEELRKLKEQLTKLDGEKRAMLKDVRDVDNRPVRPHDRAGEVNLELWHVEEVVPVVQDSGLTVGELAQMSKDQERILSGAGLEAKPITVTPQRGGRVADR